MQFSRESGSFIFIGYPYQFSNPGLASIASFGMASV